MDVRLALGGGSETRCVAIHASISGSLRFHASRRWYASLFPRPTAIGWSNFGPLPICLGKRMGSPRFYKSEGIRGTSNANFISPVSCKCLILFTLLFSPSLFYGKGGGQTREPESILFSHRRSQFPVHRL